MTELRRKEIELLAPAKNLECGIEAIRNGADAVYIGASGFGARASAGNSISDIEKLCSYAHLFGVRIYVTFNTILRDDELDLAQALIHRIYKAGADALIVQDASIFKMDIPPIPLHASTQMDLRTIDKISFFESKGVSQVVLPREMTIKEIKAISERTDIALESFIHGALCVSYSGKCYVSQALKGRSANRGECAQICRLAFDMLDADGNTLVKNQHLLSLKDMNRTDSIEEMLDAGIGSLKIEGRLKDVAYVKNITAHYRKKLDEIMSRRKEYVRASRGNIDINFTPNPSKSFNRGFTNYRLDVDKNFTSFDTPKSRGEYIGKVKSISNRFFTLDSKVEINNGDGILFFNKQGEQEGVRVNRISNGEIYPVRMPEMKIGAKVYRNLDYKFVKELERDSCERKIGITINLRDLSWGFIVEVKDEIGHSSTFSVAFEHQESKKDNISYISEQLSRLGSSVFYCNDCNIQFSSSRFMPGSLLSEIRRLLVEKMSIALRLAHRPKEDSPAKKNSELKYPEIKLSYLGNVYNSKARQFYIENGVREVLPAFEKKSVKDEPVMFTKLCLKYANGWCPVHQKSSSRPKEPLFLKNNNSLFELKFDCQNCQMLVYIKN